MLQKAVMKNTRRCLILRVSPGGIVHTQIPMMTNMLKAALPTMVAGPSSPALKLWPHTWEGDVGRTDDGGHSSISGALEPRAMSVRLDTVSFQIRTVATDVSPLGMTTALATWSPTPGRLGCQTGSRMPGLHTATSPHFSLMPGPVLLA
ncbi:hypothetical protein EYF80_012976 [Liparis tanakae]|uniref:Uncharacterized protein n=1 Tax=Liparis tanakae TaxID=230148 RepID=A0A4Z2IG11_9TELE|nr:hypothetical protein EYF80_012976 [Liparis tanakae]